MIMFANSMDDCPLWFKVITMIGNGLCIMDSVRRRL